MRNQLYLFKTKRFAPLFLTEVFGAFNDNAFKNALLIWLTYEVADKMNIDISVVVTFAAGLFILPFFLFSGLAGQIIDKYEKASLVRKIKIVEMILMSTASVCFFMHNIYGLLSALFLAGVLATFFSPIKYSLLPEHLKDDELIAGNGLIEGGRFSAILCGTIFGGLIIRTPFGIQIFALCTIVSAFIGWGASRLIPISPIGNASLNINYNIARNTFDLGRVINQFNQTTEAAI